MQKQNIKNNSIINIIINLTVACIVSGFIIGSVYYLTLEKVEQNIIDMQKNSIKNLVSFADNFKSIEGKTNWYEAIKDGEILAYILPSEGKGYGGTIKLLVAVTPKLEVYNYNIVESRETPGLGDKASKTPFKKQFFGRKVDSIRVDNKNIQAISGATITSKAVTNAVKRP